MGLYDDVWLADEISLPDGYEGRAFQTKDFDDPYLDKYRITADGRLERLDFDLEPTGEKVNYGGVEFPEERRINERWTPLDWHGWLNFYTFTAERNWHEYNAKFTDGKLVEIVSSSAACERADPPAKPTTGPQDG